MNGGFPRLSRTGQIASGYGELWLHGLAVGKRKLPIHPGYKPIWRVDDHRLTCLGPRDQVVTVDIAGNILESHGQGWGNRYAAGHGKVYLAVPGEISVDIDPTTGRLVKITEHGGNNEDRSLFVEGVDLLRIEHRPISDCRVRDNLVVWSRWEHGRPWPWGCDIDSGFAQRPLAMLDRDWQGKPVACRTPEGPWLLTMTNLDLRLHPWGSKLGFIIPTGEDFNFDPDMVWIADRALLRVVWSDKHHGAHVRDFRLSDVRQDVSVPLAFIPPPPPPPPIDPPKEPPMIMELPREAYDIYAAVFRKFENLHKGSDDDRKEGNKRCVQTMRARLKGAGVLDGRRYVCKSEHGANWGTQSKDAPGFVAPEFGAVEHGRHSRMFMFDMVSSARHLNPHPVIARNFEQGPHHNPEAYILVPEPFDWLADEEPGPVDPPVDPPPVDPPPSAEYHPFKGTGKFCPDCGQTKDAKIHQKPAEPPVSGEVPKLLERILLESMETNDELRRLRADVASASKQIVTALAAMKGGGILDVLKKEPKKRR